MSKKIYLIRHGETDFNYKGILQGSGVDASLNETGRKQAGLFYEYYRYIPFDKIYTSSLKRSIESVQHFINEGIPHESFSEFNEISWGDNDGKIIASKENHTYREIVASWSEGHIDNAVVGGESPADVLERLKSGFKYVMEKEHEQQVLICIHGRAMRILLCFLLNFELKHMDKFKHNNLCLYKLVYTGTMFRLDCANDVTHLETLKMP